VVIPVEALSSSMTPATPREPPDKATLHCPDCGHESPLDGDWNVHVHDRVTTHECPACGRTVDARRDHRPLVAGPNE
jgi:predicted RNA-binding Zn-ribbon protein involved in translation (DUF1610 family)